MDYIAKYTEFLKKHVDLKRQLKVVCDSSNGTTGIVLEKLIGVQNLELTLINAIPNPEFPAHGPNPLAEGATNILSEKVIETGADFGVIFDGDGDRAFFVDNKGKAVPSFVIANLLFKDSAPLFASDELVYMSLTENSLISGEDIIPTHAGSIFIKEAMRENDANIAAEFSGHFYFKEFFGIDSGIFSLIKIANILSRQDKSLSEINNSISQKYLVNIDMKPGVKSWVDVVGEIKIATEKIAKETSERDGITITTENGWMNVRSSHTEPLIRITAEAKTKEIADEYIALLTKAIK